MDDCFLCLPGLLCTVSPCHADMCLSHSLSGTASPHLGHSLSESPHAPSWPDISLAGTSRSQNLHTSRSFGQRRVWKKIFF